MGQVARIDRRHLGTGLIFMLFMIGLEIDLKKIVRAGRVILFAAGERLKGVTNERLVRHVRTLNPTAKIILNAELLSDVKDLYAAGADCVTVTRLSDAHELFTVIEAADAGLLEKKRAYMDAPLGERREVLP
jgi:hypothetical protein